MPDIPSFRSPWSTTEEFGREQAEFFKLWKKGWKKGQPVDVQGNGGYLLKYASVYVKDNPASRNLGELERLAVAYPNEEFFLRTCQAWIADSCLLLGDYVGAVERIPPVQSAYLGVPGNELLNRKRLIEANLNAIELFDLGKPKTTAWSKQHLQEVLSEFDQRLDEIQSQMGRSLVLDWSNGPNRYSWNVYLGTGSGKRIHKPYYCYYAHKEVQIFVETEFRAAENRARLAIGVPEVGKGWISESALYAEISRAFPELNVIHHGSPPWLGKQHLDIWIPEIAVAIEFQGDQHERAIDFFGGAESFEATKARDERKLDLCLQKGVTLIYARKGYDLAEIVSSIVALQDTTEALRREIREKTRPKKVEPKKKGGK